MPNYNRTINDPLLAGDAYKHYSYSNPVVKEQQLEKTLDLSGLRFSLDDFQKLSKGKINAGELCLDDSGKLDIVNNHKTWTILNNKAIDGADSFAIRVAFANALEAGGVDEESMDAIREKLGLGSDDSLRSAEALEPLSRQTVREIIDKHIGKLNEGREGGRRLKTYGELHAKYSKTENKDFRIARDAINAASAANNGITLNSELDAVIKLAIDAPAFEGMSEEDAEDAIDFIDGLKTAIENLQDDELKRNWQREDGGEYKVTVNGGPTSLALVMEGRNIAVETVTDGKQSRISLGVTPGEFLARLGESERRLLDIAVHGDKAQGKQHKAAPAKQKNVEPSKNLNKEPVKLAENDLIIDDGKIDLIDTSSDGREAGVFGPKEGAHAGKAEEKKRELDEKERKAVANANLNRLVLLMMKHYGTTYNVEEDEILDVIKSVDGWEEKLANCEQDTSATKLADLNEDLSNFIIDNFNTIQPRIDEIIARHKED